MRIYEPLAASNFSVSCLVNIAVASNVIGLEFWAIIQRCQRQTRRNNTVRENRHEI